MNMTAAPVGAWMRSLAAAMKSVPSLVLVAVLCTSCGGSGDGASANAGTSMEVIQAAGATSGVQIKTNAGFCLDASTPGAIVQQACDSTSPAQVFDNTTTAGKFAQGGNCLGATSSADGTQLSMMACGNAATAWTTPSSTLTHTASAKCADIPGSLSNVAGTKVQIWSCDSSNEQKFTTPTVGGVQIKTNAGFCLDASAPGAIVQQVCNSASQAQLFDNTTTAGRFAQGGNCLGVASSTDGTQLSMMACSNAATAWTTPSSTLTHTASAKCADIPGSLSNVAGTKVQIWSCDSSNEQKFTTPSSSTLLTSVSLTSTTLDFQNPERGFFVQPSEAEFNVAQLNSFATAYNSRLFRYIANIGAYRNQALPQSYLDGLAQRLAAVRASGSKLVLRFVYSSTADPTDAPLSIVQQHLAQLKPVLATYVDTIAFMEAGLIGAWGEGWSSTNGLDTPSGKAGVRDALLANVPSNLPIGFQAVDVQNWNGMARISAKNDCFMASDDDEYNFPGGLTSPLRAYMSARNDTYPYGGETCPGSNPRRSCAAILSEGPYYKLAYLNQGYDAAFIDQWRAENCMAQVSRSMGYRFQLNTVSHPAVASAGTTVNVSISLSNVGWSRIFSARKLNVTLRNTATGALVTGAAGNLNAIAAGASATINVPVSASAVGDYEVLVSAPDIYPATASDVRQAVRFANADNASAGQAWDAATARFKVGSTLHVQ